MHGLGACLIHSARVRHAARGVREQRRLFMYGRQSFADVAGESSFSMKPVRRRMQSRSASARSGGSDDDRGLASSPSASAVSPRHCGGMNAPPESASAAASGARMRQLKALKEPPRGAVELAAGGGRCTAMGALRGELSTTLLRPRPPAAAHAAGSASQSSPSSLSSSAPPPSDVALGARLALLALHCGALIRSSSISPSAVWLRRAPSLAVGFNDDARVVAAADAEGLDAAPQATGERERASEASTGGAWWSAAATRVSQAVARPGGRARSGRAAGAGCAGCRSSASALRAGRIPALPTARTAQGGGGKRATVPSKARRKPLALQDASSERTCVLGRADAGG